MNIFKRISLYFVYVSKLKSIKTELELEFNARIDNISRIYTVLNIPDNLFEEPYNIRTTDIDTMSRPFIMEYRRRITDFLVNKGLMELFELYEIRKVGKYNYLLIFGFSLINTKSLANRLIIFLPIISVLILLIYTVIKIYQTLNF